LRVRDRRDNVRAPDDDNAASSRRTVRPAGGEAYQLARRLVSLVLGHSAELHSSLAGRRAESLGELIGALPDETRAKAEELLAAIENARN
jgi:hypothetical protein